MRFHILGRYKDSFIYAVSLALLLFSLKWLGLRLVLLDHAFEIYSAAIALLFTGLGIWLALKLAKPRVRTVIIEKEVFIEKKDSFSMNREAFERLGLSKREFEVLQLMAEGLSNQEIASRLFLSLHTIKTHSSKLFEKMDVERRTQAVETAKKLGILPR